jgi:endogenous inhibitor of DNA gyrase (YacG/DUF329 family)
LIFDVEAMPKKKKLRSLRCPTCRTLVLQDSEDFPFCSDRCRAIDLGKWASGGYVISTKINDPEMLEGLANEQSQDDGDSSSHEQ